MLASIKRRRRRLATGLSRVLLRQARTLAQLRLPQARLQLSAPGVPPPLPEGLPALPPAAHGSTSRQVPGVLASRWFPEVPGVRDESAWSASPRARRHCRRSIRRSGACGLPPYLGLHSLPPGTAFRDPRQRGARPAAPAPRRSPPREGAGGPEHELRHGRSERRRQPEDRHWSWPRPPRPVRVHPAHPCLLRQGLCRFRPLASRCWTLPLRPPRPEPPTSASARPAGRGG
jgi:hypothetical protein